jgi:hypothetical protein
MGSEPPRIRKITAKVRTIATIMLKLNSPFLLIFSMVHL